MAVVWQSCGSREACGGRRQGSNLSVGQETFYRNFVQPGTTPVSEKVLSRDSPPCRTLGGSLVQTDAPVLGKVVTGDSHLVQLSAAPVPGKVLSGDSFL